MVAFWMAVGAVRERVWRRWVERPGERPREVKLCRLEGRGAFEGLVEVSRPSEGLKRMGLEVVVGLDVKRDDTMAPFVGFGFIGA